MRIKLLAVSVFMAIMAVGVQAAEPAAGATGTPGAPGAPGASEAPGVEQSPQRGERLLELLRQRREQRAGPDAPATGTVTPGQTDLYKLADGPFKVDAAPTVTLHDAKRNKPLPLRVTFPKAEADAAAKPQTFPLIVFSHGAMGSKDAGQPLVTHWASHGYVVIQPTHGDSLSLLSDEDKRKAALGIKQYVNSEAVTGQWDDRPLDIRFVLDSLDEIEKKVPQVAGRIDRGRIGMSGHSFGAHTSMMVAGMSLKHPAKPAQRITLDDPRPRCLVIISPQGPGPSLDAEGYAGIKRPALFITGDKDGSPIRGQEGKFGQWRRVAYDSAAPGDKYLLWITDAEHDFGGINGKVRYPGGGPDNPDTVYYVKSTALAMWDAYLKDDPAAKKYLAEHPIQKITEGSAKVERR